MHRDTDMLVANAGNTRRGGTTVFSDVNKIMITDLPAGLAPESSDFERVIQTRPNGVRKEYRADEHSMVWDGQNNILTVGSHQNFQPDDTFTVYYGSPVEMEGTASLTGSVTVTHTSDDSDEGGSVDLGVIPRDVGFYSGRITITALVNTIDTITVGWGYNDLPRKLALYIDKTKDDFADPDLVPLRELTTVDIDDGQKYVFYLADPSDLVPIPLTPDGESLKIFVEHHGDTGDSIKVDVELDYEKRG